jgi:hypothetical protein
LQAVEHDDELIATEPAEHVTITDHRPQAFAHAPKQLVADRVPEAVIDDFEVVEIDEEHCDRANLGSIEAATQLIEEMGAIG